MKKILFILSSAALVFTACQKEENAADNGEGMFLTATVEQQVEGTETKSSLSGTNVSWTSGDLIKVFDADGKYDQLSAQSDGTSVSFKETGTKESGFSESGNLYAIYPWSDGATCTDGTITFTLPATQTYAAGSFGQDANVAVASFSSSSAASFKNVCGVFKLTIYGNYTVSKIELSGKNDEKLNGTFTVNAAADPFVGAAASGDPSDEEKVLTLDCSKETDGGVTLSPTKATTFYFVVPVGAFAKPEGDGAVGGFVAKVYEKDNETSYTYTELSTTADNSITRSSVKAMPESTIVPPAYQKVEYLESTGAQYINTNITISSPSSDVLLWEGEVAARMFSSRNFIFGSSTSAYSHYCEFYQNYFGQCPSGSWTKGIKLPTSGTLALDTPYKVSYQFSQAGSECSITVDNVNYSGSTTSYQGALSENFYIGHLFGAGPYDAYSSAKYYNVTMKVNNILVRNFIPAVRNSDSKPGMYDIVNGVFYVNQGTGVDFLIGSAVTH